jgi:hypothetical protein
MNISQKQLNVNFKFMQNNKDLFILKEKNGC